MAGDYNLFHWRDGALVLDVKVFKEPIVSSLIVIYMFFPLGIWSCQASGTNQKSRGSPKSWSREIKPQNQGITSVPAHPIFGYIKDTSSTSKESAPIFGYKNEAHHHWLWLIP